MKVLTKRIWVLFPSETKWLPALILCLWMTQVDSLVGSHVCMEKQRYNVTKRVKYRAPMAVRTYEWCLAVPPRCSRWTTEMKDLTRLETDERTAEIAVCCPGYVMKSATCHPKCPTGKTGHNCTEGCPKKLWGPSCSRQCVECPAHASCSPFTGNCVCDDGWKGERCENPIDDTTVMAISPTGTKAPAPTTIVTSTVTTPVSSLETTTTPANFTRNYKILRSEYEVTTTTLPQSTSITKIEVESIHQSPPTSQHVEIVTDNYYQNFNKLTRNDIEVPAGDRATTVSILWKTTAAVTTSTLKHTTSDYNTSITGLTSKVTKTTLDDTTTTASTQKIDTSTKIVKQISNTLSNKPKEIWIKPTQKGDSILIESKIKHLVESGVPTKITVTKTIPFPDTVTTPRTIIVSIIPTSALQTAGYKKITLTSSDIKSGVKKNYQGKNQKSSSLWKIVTVANKYHTYTIPSNNKKYISVPIPTTATINNATIKPLLSNISSWRQNILSQTKPTSSNPSSQNASAETVKLQETRYFSTTTPTITTLINSKSPSWIYNNTPSSKFTKRLTMLNSYISLSTPKLLSTYHFTRPPTSTSSKNLSSHILSFQGLTTSHSKEKSTSFISTTSKPVKSFLTLITNSSQSIPIGRADVGLTNETKEGLLTKLTTHTNANNSATNPKPPTNKITPKENEDEVFAILTEPEHITAVVGEAGSDRNTDNLLSVLSIAGGVMFAMITVAIVIVMIERCRRSRYEDLMKMNMRMRAMEGDEDPPPYVRSIFHTPLPDPPIEEKSHYQPISTLDRNLKQFMRPVVTMQSVSPIMLENFRDILECHYDHLPPRTSHISFRSDTLSCSFRSSTAPSVESPHELCPHHSPIPGKTLPVTDLSVETLKHEGTVEVVDPTITEPLYAEIPCWRPASQHAIEVVNLNGEAVTEL